MRFPFTCERTEAYPIASIFLKRAGARFFFSHIRRGACRICCGKAHGRRDFQGLEKIPGGSKLTCGGIDLCRGKQLGLEFESDALCYGLACQVISPLVYAFFNLDL